MAGKRGAASAYDCTTRDVAVALKVSTQTVVNWANAGELPSTRTVGGHRRFLRTDVVAFARSNGLSIPTSFLGSSVRKVLLVDDDEDLSDSVAKYFVKLGGLQVEAAASFFEFGVAVERHAPDLIVIDLSLPGGDSVAVCEMVKRDPKSRHIPVIAWMAASDAPEHPRLRGGPFADFVHKPVQVEELLRRVQTLLTH